MCRRKKELIKKLRIFKLEKNVLLESASKVVDAYGAKLYRLKKKKKKNEKLFFNKFIILLN